jgi:hypothetical protein
MPFNKDGSNFMAAFQQAALKIIPSIFKNIYYAKRDSYSGVQNSLERLTRSATGQ